MTLALFNEKLSAAKITDELQNILFSAAYYFYHHLQELLINAESDHPIAKLNAREIQCLILLSKQYSLEAIAKKLNITERTARGLHYYYS